MKMIVLDGAKMTDKNEAHQYLKTTLSLPDYYGKNLDDMYGAICMLANAMQDEMERISGEVLKANLPWRQGELCRYKISGRGKKLQELLEEGFLSEMRSEEEKDFLDFDDPAKTSEFLGEKDLMTILSEAFRRSYADRSLYANFEYHVRGTAPGAYVPYSQKGHLGIWAEDYKGDDPGDAFDERMPYGQLRYYTPEIHRASFALPAFLSRRFE